MQPWRILLDLDGTILHNSGRQVAARQFGLSLSEPQREDSLLDRLGMSKEQFWAWWEANQEEIYAAAIALPAAIEVVTELRQSGSYVAVVTARRSSSQAVTTRWLSQHGLVYDRIVFDADDKAAIARQLGLTLGFEDDPRNALALADQIPVIFMDSLRHHEAPLSHPNIHRVQGWDEVRPLLLSMARSA